MLVEKNLKEALEYYIKGKPVTALWIGEDGGMNRLRMRHIRIVFGCIRACSRQSWKDCLHQD